MGMFLCWNAYITNQFWRGQVFPPNLRKQNSQQSTMRLPNLFETHRSVEPTLAFSTKRSSLSLRKISWSKQYHRNHCFSLTMTNKAVWKFLFTSNDFLKMSQAFLFLLLFVRNIFGQNGEIEIWGQVKRSFMSISCSLVSEEWLYSSYLLFGWI